MFVSFIQDKYHFLVLIIYHVVLPLPSPPGEIDRCLKKVAEGVEQFEDIWQKVNENCLKDFKNIIVLTQI